MNLKTYLLIDEAEKNRQKKIEAKYRSLFNAPEKAEPSFIIESDWQMGHPWKERCENPALMLQAELDNIRWHLEAKDDYLPTCRVQFGSGQVASAFGSEIIVFEQSLPAAKTHPLTDINDVYHLEKPLVNAGWYAKVQEFSRFYLANMPDGVKLHLPDIQGPFNNAHLIRGDEIFVDLYDNPNAVGKLLDIVTDFMIDLISSLKPFVHWTDGWFYDMGSLWKGTARLCNCSTQMIGPEFYESLVYPQDVRFMKAIGGGRIHNCGKNPSIVRRFLSIPELSGIDYDLDYDDLFELCAKAPAGMVLSQKISVGSPLTERLIKGDWPKKRNLMFTLRAKTREEGMECMAALKQACNE